MHIRAFLILPALLLLATACSPEQEIKQQSKAGINDVQDTAHHEAVDSKQASPTTAVLEIGSTDEMIRKGKIVFLRCRSCHTLEPDGIHLTGPNLNGLFGSKAGQKDGYVYSEAIKTSEITWNEATLSAWFENPQGVIKGNVMAFPGLPKEENRHALIAFLRANTAN